MRRARHTLTDHLKWTATGCHDLAYGRPVPTEGRDIRGLSQLDYLGHILVRRPTGQVPLPVDGTFRNLGLQSRATRWDVGPE